MASCKFNQFMDNVNEQLQCTICLKTLQNPKSLNCLHSFCLVCLEDWVRTTGTLRCPCCSRLHEIPKGGLKMLPPNTVLNNILETIEHFSEGYERVCVCGIKGEAESYCQECNEYLCPACSSYHQKLPVLANHKLLSIKGMQTISSMVSVQPVKCMVHNKPLEVYCMDCKQPICVNCTIMGHNCEGKLKPITISDAFQTFKETSEELEKSAHRFKIKLQVSLNTIVENATRLEKTKEKSLSDIENHVQELVETIKKSGEKIKTEVENIYKKKKKTTDVQIDELEMVITDVNIKLGFLNQLLKSDEVTAMQSSDQVTKGLQERIKNFPQSDLDNNGEIDYVKNPQLAIIQQCDIGNVSQSNQVQENSITDTTDVKPKECSTGVDKIKVELKYRKKTETNDTQVENVDITQKQAACGEDHDTETTQKPAACGEDHGTKRISIKNSKAEKQGLVNIIETNIEFCTDINKCDDFSFLIAGADKDVYSIRSYNQLQECTSKISLTAGVRINKIHKMKNGNVAFTDDKCIRICNEKGEVINTIGEGVLKKPGNICLNEKSDVVYVADYYKGVFMFNIKNGKLIKRIGSGIHVMLTNQDNVLLLYKRKIKLFDNEGNFSRLLINKGDEISRLQDAKAVTVDVNDNIVVLTQDKLKLFSSDGTFIKRIDNKDEEINYPKALCVINPQQVAVLMESTVKIFNY